MRQLGLLVNVGAAWVLHRSAKDSLNVEGVFQHVMADLLGSVGVVISGIVILTTGWNMVDPILSVVIAFLILRSAWPLSVKVFHVLVDSVPADIDVYKLGSDLEVEGVTVIHDIHIRAVSSDETTFSGHVMIDPDYPGDTNLLLRRLRKIIKGHGITTSPSNWTRPRHRAVTWVATRATTSTTWRPEPGPAYRRLARSGRAGPPRGSQDCLA